MTYDNCIGNSKGAEHVCLFKFIALNYIYLVQLCFTYKKSFVEVKSAG